jgi:hypothetical protein
LFARTVARHAVPVRQDGERRAGTLTRLYRHAGRTVHHGATRAIAVPPTRRGHHGSWPPAAGITVPGHRPQASRFLANAGQRRRQRRAISAGSTQRRNRTPGERDRVRITGIIHDAPHHTPTTARLDEPETPIGPGNDGYTPVTHTHLSPTNVSICATKPCNADTCAHVA